MSRYNRIFLNFREFIDSHDVLFFLYLTFLIGFFISPSTSWHNNFFYIFIIPLFIITLHKEQLKSFFLSKTWIISIILVIYLAITLLWAQDSDDNGFLYYIRRPVYIFVFLSLTMTLVMRYPKFINTLLMSLPWIGALTGIISILSFYDTLSMPPERLSFFSDQLQNPIEGSTVLGTAALVTYFYIPKKSTKMFLIYALLFFILIVSVLLAQSRAPAAALIMAFLAGGILAKDKKVLIFIIILSFLGIFSFFKIPAFKESVIERGFSYRLETCKAIISKSQENLIFGKGLSTHAKFVMKNDKIVNHTHNVYLGMILYGGLVGLMLLLSLLFLALLNSISYFIHHNEITFLVLIIFAAICMLTGEDKIITHPDAIWVFFWLPLGLLSGLECKQNISPQAAQR